MENRVEQYIKDYTRKCSNEQGGWSNGKYIVANHSWLTPDDARRVAEIAREEVTDKTAEWLKDFCNEHYIMSYSDSHEVDIDELMEIFKKKMEE